MPLWDVGVRPGHLGTPEHTQSTDAYLGELESWRARHGLQHPEGSPRSRYDGAAARLSMFATDAEKVKHTFRAFDANRDGKVDAAEFARGLDGANFGLSLDTIREIFERAGGAETGDVTKEQWEALCKRYPCLRDALWRRSALRRDADLARRGAQADQGRLARQRAAAEVKLRNAERECEAAQLRLSRDVEQLDFCSAEEDRRREAIDAGHRVTEEAKQRRDSAIAALRARGPAAAAASQRLRELTDQHSSASRQYAAAVARYERAEDALRAAADAKREAHDAFQRLDSLLEAARAEQGGGPTPEEQISAADRELQDARAAERAAAGSARDASRATVAAQKEEAESREKLAKALETLKACEAAFQSAVSREADNGQRQRVAEEALRLGPERDATGEMSGVGQAINTVVAAELRIKEQREAVKERERALADAREAAFSSPPPRLSSPIRRRPGNRSARVGTSRSSSPGSASALPIGTPARAGSPLLPAASRPSASATGTAPAAPRP